MIGLDNVSVITIYVSHKSEGYIKKFSERHRCSLGKKVLLINSSSNNIDAKDFHDIDVVNIGENVCFHVTHKKYPLRLYTDI